MLGIHSNLNMPEICKMITIGQQEMPALPLGQTIFGYTFAYLLYVIVKYKFWKQNMATLIFFPVLIIFDGFWNYSNHCYNPLVLAISCVVGGFFGLLWAYIIDSTKSKNLQYFVGVNNNEVCSKPSKSTFRCNVYKNGKIISKM
jgi:hypothetical protein